jgi:hypothetical protein
MHEKNTVPFSHLPNPNGSSALASAPPVASFWTSATFLTEIPSVSIGFMLAWTYRIQCSPP